VADHRNNRIAKVFPDGEIITLAGSERGFLDGQGTNAMFNSPHGIACDKDGNIYVADCDNHRIRKITASGLVTTVAGYTRTEETPTNNPAYFHFPMSVVVDFDQVLYVCDHFNSCIKKIAPSGEVMIYAGICSSAGYRDGPASTALFMLPVGLVIDKGGSCFIADPQKSNDSSDRQRRESDNSNRWFIITSKDNPNLPGIYSMFSSFVSNGLFLFAILY